MPGGRTNASLEGGNVVGQGDGSGNILAYDKSGNVIFTIDGTNRRLTMSTLLADSAANAVTAFAGGGQTNATPLTAQNNRISICATAGDSVRLPASVAGLEVIVYNAGAADAQVYGAGTDTIDGVATATGVSHPRLTEVIYACYAAGNWVSSIAGGISYGLNRITDVETLVADSNATVTAAQLLAGFLRSIPTAGRTWTLDTSANIDAAIPNVKNGMSFNVIINNNSAGANSIQFTAGAGMTFFPSAGVTIAQNKTATLTFLRTGTATYNVYHQVGA
jgi:hypothetical protein